VLTLLTTAALLTPPAAAAICCTATGGDPLALQDCEGLATLSGVAVSAEPGKQTLTPSLTVMGRASRSLVLGLRAPLLFEHSGGGLDWGVGHLYPWARLERRFGVDAVGAWTLAVGSVGPDAALGAGSLRVETGPSVAWSARDRVVAARGLVKAPVVGRGELEGRLEVAAGRGLGRAQLGVRGEVIGVGLDEALQRVDLMVGPAAWLRAGEQGRVALSLAAGPRLVSADGGWVAGLSAAWLAPL